MSQELCKGNCGVVPSVVQDTATTLTTTLYQLGLTTPNSPSCTSTSANASASVCAESIHKSTTTPCSGLQTPPSENADAETDEKGDHEIESNTDQEEEEAELESSSTTAHPESEETIIAPFSVTKSRIRLDISSDTTCPWCFIAKRRIAKAIQMFYALSSPEHETKRVRFDIHWHPYQLDPQAPLVPILKSKLYTRKFGPDQAIFVRDRVVQAAKVEGIEFLPADQCLYRNTLISHRLIKYARERLGRELFEASFKSRHTNIDNNSSISRIENDDDGEQKGEEEEEEEEEEEIDEFGNMVEDAMVEELFHSHFERGECGDIPTLKKCARNVLLALAADHAAAGNEPVDTEKIEREVEEIERYLATDEDLQQIMDEIQVAKHQMGFHGVPTIVVQSMYLVPGGQDCATFVEIFKRVV